jgi:hypothetical protein
MQTFAVKTRAAAARSGRAHAIRRTPDVRHILRAPQVQTKLKIGAVDDPAEREADRVADQVMRMPDTGLTTMAAAPGKTVQRACAACEGEIQRMPDAMLQRDIGDGEIQAQLVQAYLSTTGTAGSEADTVQRKAADADDDEGMIQTKRVAGPEGGDSGPALQSRVGALSGGSPLAQSIRGYMEPRFGRDFGGVRVHADQSAAETARLANARAFTIGRDVVFGAGEYAPQSAEGRSLIAHELTHVVQQGATGPSLQRKIMVGGKRYVPGAFYLSYLEAYYGPAMKEFVEKMDNNGNPPEYTFADNNKLTTEIEVRGAAIKGMNDVHSGRCGYFGASPNGPNLDPTYWDHIGSGVSFKTKSTAKPSNAISAIFQAGANTRIECMTMMVAIEYRAMLKGIGAAAFDKKFAAGIELTAKSAQPIVTGASRTYDVITIGSNAGLLPGDWVYFKNFKDYTTRVPGGYWQGENAVCMGGGKYRGFGVASKTETELNQELVDRYNKDGKPVLNKTVADLLADGGGLLLNLVVRPKTSAISP